MFVLKSKYKELLKRLNHISGRVAHLEMRCFPSTPIESKKASFTVSESVDSKLTKEESVNTSSVGKGKHRNLYTGMNTKAFIDGRPFLPYREDLVIDGHHLAHYKWSWKLNKAVKVKG